MKLFPDRKRMIPCSAAMVIFAASITLFAQVRIVETPNATLRLDEGSCDLVGVHWKSPALDIINEPKLGENFRILLPRPGYEAAYFNSREQKVSRIESAGDGVTCYYGSLGNAQEVVPLRVWYKIRSVGGQIQFSIEVDNPTGRKLAEVFFGILGGLQGIGNRLDTLAMVSGGTDNLLPKPFTAFQGGQYGGGNLGIRYDAIGFTYPGSMPMGWMDVYNSKAGLGYYYGNQDPDTRLMALYFELRPFTNSISVSDNWPSPNHLPADEPIGLTMGWVNFPYTANGRFSGGPLALQVHNGDWHTASSLYRSWFDQHFTIQRPLSWLRQEMAWQSIIISNPEDVIVHRFSELPKLAADAKKYGINTFEILGWDMGGIDRGYPQYQPNPRLGTPDEFHDSLAKIRAVGVHPLLFANVEVADTATPLFRNRLARYAVEGPWAPDLYLMGWGEGTIAARLGLARSNMTLVSPAQPKFRTFLMNQYLQMVRDGADGFQLDKTGVGLLDFNRSLPVSPDKSLPSGTLTTLEELLRKARVINPNFSLASEIWVDRAMPYVDISYMRMDDMDMGSTALHYTFPEWTSTIFGESPGDFSQMNNGMRYGLVWALAPRHYNDSVDEPLTQPLARYVSELIRIRKQNADLLFFGRFNDTLGADVKADADIRYSTFTSLKQDNQDRAAVLVNFSDHPESATLDLPGRNGQTIEISAPFESDRTAILPLHLVIPGRRCVVVIARSPSNP